MKKLDPGYLRHVYDGLVSGQIHPENPSDLPEGLIGLYEEAFDESISVVARQKNLNIFCLWALLKKEVSAAFVAEILDMSEVEINLFISKYSSWFNSPTSGKYQLYHERLKVFLLQKNSEKEIRALIIKIIEILKSYYDSNSKNENNEYSLMFFLDYIHVKLCIDKEYIYDNIYINFIKKDPEKLFYLENGRNHRERHLRQATRYFSNVKNLKILDELVHEINKFQNTRRSPIELSNFFFSSNREDQIYGYNLCSSVDEKIFVLIFLSIYHSSINLTDWHNEIIKDFWNEIKSTSKIYDIPSFFLLSLVPLLVDFDLIKYEDIDIKKIDFRLIYCRFNHKCFDVFYESQKYNDESFYNYDHKENVLFQLEIEFRKSNHKYFEKIDSIKSLSDHSELSYFLNSDMYFNLPFNSYNPLNDYPNEFFTSECIYEIFNDEHKNKGLDKRSIIDFCISNIRIGKLSDVLTKLNFLKQKLNYHDKHTGDSLIEFYNEVLSYIFSFCLLNDYINPKDLLDLMYIFIKDNSGRNKDFYGLSSYWLLCHDLDNNYDFYNIEANDRANIVYCNYLYRENKLDLALSHYSNFLLKNSKQADINEYFYEINFLNVHNLVLERNDILNQYYNNTYSIKQSIPPIIKYSLRIKNCNLLWNFINVNQEEMSRGYQIFWKTRGYAFNLISSLLSEKNFKISIYFFLEAILQEFRKSLEEPFGYANSLDTEFLSPVSYFDFIEILYVLKKSLDKTKFIYFEKQIFNYINLMSQDRLGEIFENQSSYIETKELIKVGQRKWKKSEDKDHLREDLSHMQKEEYFIQDYNHHLLLLNRYFDHPEYIHSISYYSGLFKKYKIKPKKLSSKSNLISNRLINLLKGNDEFVHPQEVSPSDLMYSYYIIGKGYYFKDDYLNAVKCFKKSIDNKIENSGISLGQCYLYLGKSHYYLDNYNKSIQSLNFAKKEFKKISNDSSDMGQCYLYLGYSYYYLDNYNKSIESLNFAKKELKKISNDSYSLRNVYYFLGHCYLENNLWKNSICSYNEGQRIDKGKLKTEINDESDNRKIDPIYSYNIAYCYERLGQINNAIHFYINYLDEKSEDDFVFNLVKEGDEDFFDYNDELLLKSLDYIKINSDNLSKIDNWIKRLIEIKSKNN